MLTQKRRAVSINEDQNSSGPSKSVAYKMPEETKDLHKAEILKKIPEGAEAFAVLVGVFQGETMLTAKAFAVLVGVYCGHSQS